MFLFSCIQGLMGDSMPNNSAFRGAHHQFTHNADALLGIALLLPYVEMSDSALTFMCIAILLGTWCNPVGYAVAAFSGDEWLGGARVPVPNVGQWTMWSNLSFFLVPVITAPTCIIGFAMMLWGVSRHSGVSVLESGKSN